jgi:hypothetical protein
MVAAFEGEEALWLGPEVIEHVNDAENNRLGGRQRRVDISVFPLVWKKKVEDIDMVKIVSRAKVVPTKIPTPIRLQRRWSPRGAVKRRSLPAK